MINWARAIKLILIIQIGGPVLITLIEMLNGTDWVLVFRQSFLITFLLMSFILYIPIAGKLIKAWLHKKYLKKLEDEVNDLINKKK